MVCRAETSIPVAAASPSSARSSPPLANAAVATAELELNTTSKPTTEAAGKEPDATKDSPAVAAKTTHFSNPRKSQKRPSSCDIDSAIALVDKQLTAEPEDEAEIFCHSVAAKLRRFNSYQFALARRNIENMLFDIEFNNATQPQTQAQSQMPVQSHQPAYQQQPSMKNTIRSYSPFTGSINDYTPLQ